MNKIYAFVLTAGLVALSQFTFAQEQPTKLPTDFKLDATQLKDGYARYQGAMVQLHNGQVSPLTKDVTLKNGIKVSKDGFITRPGKKPEKLAENYVINMDGKVVMLQYDMLSYKAIQEYSQKTLGNTDTEIIVTDKGAVIPNKAGAGDELINRRVAIINERNALVQQKATVLNQLRDKQAQQNSQEVKNIDAKIKELSQELKQIEQKISQQ